MAERDASADATWLEVDLDLGALVVGERQPPARLPGRDPAQLAPRACRQVIDVEQPAAPVGLKADGARAGDIRKSVGIDAVPPVDLSREKTSKATIGVTATSTLVVIESLTSAPRFRARRARETPRAACPSDPRALTTTPAAPSGARVATDSAGRGRPPR